MPFFLQGLFSLSHQQRVSLGCDCHTQLLLACVSFQSVINYIKKQNIKYITFRTKNCWVNDRFQTSNFQLISFPFIEITILFLLTTLEDVTVDMDYVFLGNPNSAFDNFGILVLL